jgi:hypothetical protein
MALDAVAGAVHLIIAERANGRKYLKTAVDGQEPNGLLGLLRCR